MSRARNVALRRVGPAFLAKVLNWYKFNSNDRNKIVDSYMKYLNALNNKNRQNAHNNAEKASEQFVTTLFDIYEKAANRPRTPSGVRNGIRNGVRKSVLWMLPGVLMRGAVRHVSGPRRVNANNLN
jgi:plasmid stabilization system protein ParE